MGNEQETEAKSVEKSVDLDAILGRFKEHLEEKIEIVYDDKGESDSGKIVIGRNGKPTIEYGFTDLLIGRIMDREIKEIFAVTENGKELIYEAKRDGQIYLNS